MPDNIRRIHINELKAGDIIYYNDRSQGVIDISTTKSHVISCLFITFMI